CRPGVTYCYRVDVTDEDGRRTLFETGAISAPLLAVTLEQNQPNPFNPTTTISFTLPEKMEVNLSIYNVAGKLVTTVVNRALPDGLNEFAWDGTDANGNPVSSGVYLYRLTAGKKSITRKMVMLK
ncbi:MAG: FlgD immunoglobulin-like domain containing protein, partial [Candidatus Latescibacterota bacterium]